MVCLTCLENISDLELNTTILDNASTNIIPVLSETANTASDGYFALGVSISLFLFLMITLFRQDQDIRLDSARTIFISSGIVVILNILMLVTNFSNSVQPLLWFFALFVLSAMSVYHLKSNNLV